MASLGFFMRTNLYAAYFEIFLMASQYNHPRIHPLLDRRNLRFAWLRLLLARFYACSGIN